MDQSTVTEKLLIFGDSWSLGTWRQAEENQLELDDPGLGKILEDSFSVVNLSKGYSSNWQMLYTLWNYLDKIESVDNQSKIILFQTDAFRSRLSEKFDVDYPKIYQQSTGLENFYESLIEIFYIKLNQVAEQFNTKIYLSGTNADVHTGLIEQFPNLVPMCVSWIKLVEPAHKPSVIPLLFDRDFLKTAKSYNITLCKEIMDYSDESFSKFMSLLENKHFDNPKAFGDFHPNLLGHKVMAKYIKDYFKSK